MRPYGGGTHSGKIIDWTPGVIISLVYIKPYLGGKTYNEQYIGDSFGQ